MAVDNRRRSTDEWETVIGAEVRAARIAANLDQAELARRADISLGAVKNLEAGKGSTLKTLVRVVRALGRTEWLESLTPLITVSPLAMLTKRPATPRQRVSRRRPRSPREG
jgi:transcriptional regulator with XRE-family HTH domain